MRAVPGPRALAGQPPDGDGRLQRLRQGHGLRGLAVGALQRAGAARGAGGRRRRLAGALPRPRRLPVARRRAHLPSDPGPARGLGQRPHPDHRAGRDGLGPLRRPGARGALAGADGLGRAAGLGAAERARQGRMARRDGAPVAALARALPGAGLRGPGVPALLQRGRADRRALAAEHRLAAAVAQEVQRRRVAARDPVGVRVDPEPAAGAVLVRGGNVAVLGRSRGPPRDVPRLAVLQGPDRDAGDGAVQERPGRRASAT